MTTRTTHSAAGFLLVAAAVLLAAPATAQDQSADLEDVSIEELLNRKVSAAAKHDQTAREAPASVTVITDEDIARFGYRTLDELLATVRGFYLSDDLENTYVGIRGFGRPGDYNNRLLILVNGQPINEGASGGAFIDVRLGTSLRLVERVEVVRGPGSALYGTGAMLGVVNIVTKDAADFDGIHGGGAAGSHGYREGMLVGGKSFKNGNGITGGINWGRRDGANIYFKDLDFRQFNDGISEKNDWRDYVSISVDGNVGDFSIRASHVTHNAGDPVGSMSTVFNDGDAEKRIEIRRLEGGYERSFGIDKFLAIRAHLNHFDRFTTAAALKNEEVLLEKDEAVGTWSRGEARFRWDTSPVNRLIVGAEYRIAGLDYRRWTKHGVSALEQFSVGVASAFVQDEYRLLRDLTATAGVRYEYYTLSGSNLAPRIGFVYNVSRPATVKLLYGRAFRSPSILELEWEDLSVNFIANPHLKPEQMESLELAWEQQIHELAAASVSVYYYNMRDLIDLYVDPADFMIQYRNVGKVRALGLEAGIRLRTRSGVLGYANYSLQRARNAEPGASIPNSPRHLVKAGVNVPAFGIGHGGVEARYETARYTFFRTLTPSYGLVDFVLRTKPLVGRLSLTARVTNALNASYRLPGNPDDRPLALTQYGRRFIFELRYSF